MKKIIYFLLISILAGCGGGNDGGIARDASRIAELMTTRSALDTYFNDNGNYPRELENVLDHLPGGKMPFPPLCYEDQSYCLEYKQTNGGTDFELRIKVEEKSNATNLSKTHMELTSKRR